MKSIAVRALRVALLCLVLAPTLAGIVTCATTPEPTPDRVPDRTREIERSRAETQGAGALGQVILAVPNTTGGAPSWTSSALVSVSSSSVSTANATDIVVLYGSSTGTEIAAPLANYVSQGQVISGVWTWNTKPNTWAAWPYYAAVRVATGSTGLSVYVNGDLGGGGGGGGSVDGGTFTANQGAPGTAAWPVSISGSLPAGTNDIGTVGLASWIGGSTAPTVGQKAGASSIPVVLASDQGTIPVTIVGSGDAGVPVTFPDGGVVVANQGAAGSSPWPVSISGSLPAGSNAIGVVSALQDGAWTVSATQGTSPWVVSDAQLPASLGPQASASSLSVVPATGATFPISGSVTATISGTVPVTQSTSPWVTSGTVTGTVTTNQGTSPWVVSDAQLPSALGPQASASSLSVVPATGSMFAVTQSTSPWLVSQSGSPWGVTDTNSGPGTSIKGTSPLTATGFIIKSGSCVLLGGYAYNLTGGAAYFMVFNGTALPLPGTVPDFSTNVVSSNNNVTLTVPADGVAMSSGCYGVWSTTLSTGLAVTSSGASYGIVVR